MCFSCCKSKSKVQPESPTDIARENSKSEAVQREASKAYSYASKSIPRIDSPGVDDINVKLPKWKVIKIAGKEKTVQLATNLAIERVKCQDEHDKYEM